MKTFFKTRTRLDDRIDREKGEADTWRDVCAAVDTRDRYRCRACGRTLQRCLSALPNRLERHHVVPLSLGGRDERANVCQLCLSCHNQRHVTRELLIEGNADRVLRFQQIDIQTGHVLRKWQSAAPAVQS